MGEKKVMENSIKIRNYVWGAVIRDCIERERKRTDFIYNDHDYMILQKMLKEINSLGYTFKYLCEIEAYRIPGSGEIIEKYITEFYSETTKAYLIPNMYLDLGKKCSKKLFDMYLHFKNSNECPSQEAKKHPVHIYVRYDNAFSRLKPKSIKADLVKLAENPIDFCEMPFTMRLLARWELPEMENLLCDYATRSYEKHMRESRFTALNGLRYFPTERSISILEKSLQDDNEDIRVVAKKSLQFIEKRKQVDKGNKV